MFSNLYNLVVFQPLLNLLVLLYNLLGQNMGLAIIAMTVVIRLLLYPSFKHQLESQKKMAVLQPKLRELQNQHKDNKEEQSRALMQFYREHKINPLGSCLPLVIQLIVLIGLFQVFRQGLNGATLEQLYPFVHNPGAISTTFFNLFDLKQPNVPLAIVTGIFQYIQSRQMMALQPPAQPTTGGTPDVSAMVSKQMMYLLPVMTVVFGATLQSGLTLYWLVTTLFSIAQQYIVMRKDNVSQSVPIQTAKG